MNIFEVMTGPIARMSYVNRYSSFSVNRRENVAEHSWWVCFIAYCIAGDLYKNGEHIDFESLLEHALMHDVSECLSGDVIRSYKHTNPDVKQAMAEADQINTRGLFDRDEYKTIGKKLYHDWATAKHNGRLEGEIVAFADMAAVGFYCREEDRSGNRAIRSVLAEMFEQWFHEFSQHPLLGQYVAQMFPEGRWPDMLRESSLPAQKMFPVPMMRDHSEGPTIEHEFRGTGTP